MTGAEATRIIERLSTGYGTGDARSLMAGLREQFLGEWHEERLPNGVLRREWRERHDGRPGLDALLAGEPAKSGRLPKPEPDPVIRLSERAIKDIAWSAFWEGSDGLETGGWLRGQIRGGEVRVSSASRPTARTIRGPRRLVLDVEAAEGWEIGGDDEPLGNWHSHPGGETAPSKADARSWNEAWRALSLDGSREGFKFASLIVAAAADSGWHNPALRGYVIEDEGSGQPVLKEAELKGGL